VLFPIEGCGESLSPVSCHTECMTVQNLFIANQRTV
jgi:hypothetical protein